MRIRLRQVALVAADLSAVETQLETQFGVGVCFRDAGVATFGLTNALFPVGDKLLEVVSPSRDDTTAGRLLRRRGGDGGYMVIVQVDDLEAMRRRLHHHRARVVFEAVAPGVRGLHIHPRDIGGAIVSVDQTDVWDEWPWAGPTWRDQFQVGSVTDITAVEIEANDPQAMAERWAELLGVDIDGQQLLLDEGTIRFVAERGRGEGVGGVDFVGTGGESLEVDICGTRLRVEPQSRPPG